MEPRKAAIDKLASPERLDVLMQVTSPRGWLALWTVGAFLVGVIVWSVTGSIPTRIEGQGLLIRGGGLRELRASGDGMLTRLDLTVNDAIQTNRVVGEIAERDVQDSVRAARDKYEAAQRDYAASRGEDEATNVGTRSTIAANQADIERTNAELAKTRQDLEAKKELLQQGLITKSRVQALERDEMSLEANITRLQATIAGLNASIRGVDQRIRARADEVDAARRALDRVRGAATAVTQITATVAGRIVEVKKKVGDRVNNGEVLAIIEPPSSTIEPIVYVNSATGKRIKAGMEAQISPSTVRREEYGFMKGVVHAVGDYSVTPDALQAVVANPAVVQELLGGTSKLEVRLSLVPDTHTPSGYAWSSSSGPPFRIEGGTRVVVSVVVDRRAPITYVLPMLKDTLGAG
jgi:HlyD family secretion protein